MDTEDCMPGDVNADQLVNVQDIVSIVLCILDGTCDFEASCGDINFDGLVNVQDVVAIVSYILGGRTTSDATESILEISNGTVNLIANGFVGAVQMTVNHNHGFAIQLTEQAMVTEYRTNSNSTELIIVAPSSNHLFDAKGDFSIEAIQVYNSEELVPVSAMPNELVLSKAYPNPFNPSTNLTISLEVDSFVDVSVYNAMGQRVDNLHRGSMSAGVYKMTWDASNMTSGVYFIRAESMNSVSIQKVMMLK